ncbi:MAG: acyl-CoA desaturase [Bacteroidetes bacterium]|nr:acyl-CoA desaturase [Bacteroidota bacterium]
MSVHIPKFPSVTPSFHSILKHRIEEYFQKKGISSHGNFQLFFKAALLVSLFVVLYIHLVFFTPHWYFALPEAIILGFVISFIGFNVMHDGSHGSFSNYKWLNRIAAYTVNVLGASSFMWNIKHNIIHHTYTNIDGLDDDINAGILLRFNKYQKYYKIHRFQHIYVWFLYSLLYMFWVFYTDYKKYFLRKIGIIPLKKLSILDHILFWGFKALNLFLFIALPIYTVGFTWWLLGFLIVNLLAGFVLSIVFQLAHTVSLTSFPNPTTTNGKMEDEWAINQIKTTADFAPNSKLISWCVGGLNFQVEHHLFPKISHVHYPAISKIISATCKEFAIPYSVFPKMRHAVASHVSHLRAMGKA